MFLEKDKLSWNVSTGNVDFIESKFREYCFYINKLHFIILVYKNNKIWRNIAAARTLKEAEDRCNELYEELNHTMKSEIKEK